MRMINSSVQKKLIWQYGSHIPAGLVPISRTAVTNSSGVTISSGIDSTYDAYVFKIYNFNPATNNAELEFQVNAAGASGFNETITSLRVYAYSDEGDSATAFGYDGTNDQANGTGYQSLSDNTGSGADESSSGTLTLYDPSNDTYVKHFVAQFTNHLGIEYMRSDITTGYFDVATAIDEINFKASSGNFDAIITMYGVA